MGSNGDNVEHNSLAPVDEFRRHALRGQLAYTVDESGRPVWPPQTGLAWQPSAGEGTVYATTSNHTRDQPPRNVSLIDLDEGFRMMSTVTGEDVYVGMRVRVRFAGAVAVFDPA